jgi:hypothetical protein
MTMLRSDIERALDDLISHEEGMTFERMATVLAEKKWPDVRASAGCSRLRDSPSLSCSRRRASALSEVRFLEP